MLFWSPRVKSEALNWCGKLCLFRKRSILRVNKRKWLCQDCIDYWSTLLISIRISTKEVKISRLPLGFLETNSYNPTTPFLITQSTKLVLSNQTKTKKTSKRWSRMSKWKRGARELRNLYELITTKNKGAHKTVHHKVSKKSQFKRTKTVKDQLSKKKQKKSNWKKPNITRQSKAYL